jgi:ferrous iron transport protein A
MEITTLDLIREGSVVTVLEISGGGWVRRLYQMGILPGSQVKVVFNRGVEPIVVRIGNVEVSLGKGIARRIVVKVTQG